MDGKRRTDDDQMIFDGEMRLSTRVSSPSTPDCRRSICLEGSRMKLRCHGVLVRSIELMLTVGCLAGFGPAPAVARAGEPLLQIEVDARDLPRKLLHTSLRIPCEAGAL